MVKIEKTPHYEDVISKGYGVPELGNLHHDIQVVKGKSEWFVYAYRLKMIAGTKVKKVVKLWWVNHTERRIVPFMYGGSVRDPRLV